MSFLSPSIFFAVFTLAFGLYAKDPPEGNQKDVPPSSFMIGDKPVAEFGRSWCTVKNKKLNLALAKSLNGDEFRGVFKDTKCPSSFSAGGFDINANQGIAEIGEENLKRLIPSSYCGEEGKDGTRFLCIYDDDKLVSKVSFHFNTRVMSIKSINNINAVNKKIEFTVETKGGSSGQVAYQVCYTKDHKDALQKLAKGAKCEGNLWKSNKSASKTIVIEKNIENHETYYFRVRVGDQSGNISEWSEMKEATPVPVAHPLDTLKGELGEFSFEGCQQVSASRLLFLAILGLLFLRLRRWKLPNHLLVLLLAFPLATEDLLAEAGQMNLGITGSMYRPNLDASIINGNKVDPFYRNFFRKKPGDKEGPINPLMGLEFDWHIWDGMGSLQLGFGVSYTLVLGNTLEIGRDGTILPDKPKESDKVWLHLYQFRPQLTYLFNPFADDFPLFPYAKAALVAQGYSFYGGSSSKEITSPVKNNGFRFGYQFDLGLMLQLDFLEPSAVASAHSGSLFNHVYLQGGLSFMRITSFGRPGGDFSAKDIMGSDLPIMWTFGLVFELP